MTRLLPLLLCLFNLPLTAQQRYLDVFFPEVSVDSGLIYASNFWPYPWPPSEQPLHFDIYRPVGDVETDRPVVVYLHTGYLIPKQDNLRTTGAKDDYTVQETCRRLASMGYVVAAIEYRTGWNPFAGNPVEMRATFLQAVLRAVQDVRTFVRYLHRSVAVEDNPFGIDPGKIAVYGQGAGGVVALANATLTQDELFLPIFSDTSGTFFIDTTLWGNLDGTLEATYGQSNHLGFPSDVQFTYSAGGVVVDSTWLDPGEGPILAAHTVYNAAFPFGINYTTGEPVCKQKTLPLGQPVIIYYMAGPKCFIELVNELGNNDPILKNDQGEWLNFSDSISLAIDQIPHAEPNLWPVWTPPQEDEPWEYWDEEYWSTVPHPICADPPPTCSYHTYSLFFNPDMSLEKANRYIDTLVAFFAPRACLALNLGCEIEMSTANLERAGELASPMVVSPNPSDGTVSFSLPFRTEEQGQLELFSGTGHCLYRQVTAGQSVEAEFYRLPPGLYTVRWQVGKYYCWGKMVRY